MARRCGGERATPVDPGAGMAGSVAAGAGLRGLRDPSQPQQICTILRGDEPWRSVRPPTPSNPRATGGSGYWSGYPARRSVEPAKGSVRRQHRRALRELHDRQIVAIRIEEPGNLRAIWGGPNATIVLDHEGYAKPSLKKCRPIAARNEDKKVFSGRL